VMTAFAQSVNAGPDHHVVVVEDGAGFHVCDDDGWPAGLQRVTLPPYSPELQPAERLWAPTDATVANTWFESLDALIEVLGRQCAWLETQHDLLTRHTLFPLVAFVQELIGVRMRPAGRSFFACSHKICQGVRWVLSGYPVGWVSD
jgi:hypothetical protein